MSSPFAEVVADLDYPMAVVTGRVGEEMSGCLVGFASQCSIDPPLVMVWISKANHTHAVALSSEHLAVHWLSSAERELAQVFGSTTGDIVDKFSYCRWRPGAGGVPVIEQCGRWFVGRVLERYATGDHTAFLLDPVEVSRQDPWPGQLGYQSVRDLQPGHEA